ncbi:helix-turn-helix domain-containing protein [Clostridium sp. MCC353]|uniref:PucR family transcriptional regulator n=1 Tax=Clostridium sp. MCC353 TaxID=2592646 RepID=UPI001C02A46B|nr:helix-turn-helix domain-containing protein [Clostridium sp. MCC353]
MITFHHIIAKLKDAVVSYQLPFNQFSLSNRLIFLDEDLSTPLVSDSFIFCSTETFNRCMDLKLPPRICFFVSGTRQELPVHIPHTCNYIAVSLSFPVLCTRVMEIYQNYSSCRDKLSRLLPNRQCIETYLKDLSLSLNSACYLYNDEYQLLLYAHSGGRDDVVNTDFIVSALEKKPFCVTQDPTYGCYSYLEQQTFHNRTFYLHFVCHSDFSDYDISWIAAEALSHILTSISDYNIPLYTTKELAAQRFLNEIMDGSLSNWNEVGARYTSLTPYPVMFTTVVYILMPEAAEAMSHVFFLSELNRLFPDFVTGPYENDLIMLAPNSDKYSRLDLHNQEFNRLLERYSAFAGCSLWTKFRLRTSVILARSNAFFGMTLHLEGSSRIFYHNEYALYHLIDLAADSFREVHQSRDLTYLLHPCILKINGYDLSHNTNLLEVLYCYLLNGCSINDTAAHLNVHRNTIQGKILKLNDLVNEDFTKNGLIQCRLLMSCMIFFYQDRYLKEPFSRPQSMQYSFKNLDGIKK